MAVWYLPVSPPSVSATRAEIRSEYGTPADAVVILQVSRLERWKGHAVLIDALSCLSGLPNWECWVVGGAQKAGEKQYRAELRAAARRGGIASRVRFLGQRSDVPRLTAAADIFCQPNTGPEPFGIVFVEALYAGLPVVTSSIGGAAEIVTADCGILTPAGDARAVAGALATLVRDPQLARTIGAAGPARARELCHPENQLAALFHHLRGTRAESAEAVVRAPAPTNTAPRSSPVSPAIR